MIPSTRAHGSNVFLVKPARLHFARSARARGEKRREEPRSQVSQGPQREATAPMLLSPFSCAPKAARAGKGDHNIGTTKAHSYVLKLFAPSLGKRREEPRSPVKPGFPGFDTTLTCQTLPGLTMRAWPVARSIFDAPFDAM